MPTPEQLDQEVRDLYEKRRLEAEGKVREKAEYARQRLRDKREKLLSLNYWPPCNSEKHVRSILAMDGSVCNECGE